MAMIIFPMIGKPLEPVGLLEEPKVVKLREVRALKKLLAKTIGVDDEDFTFQKFDQLISIGMGMYWSEELDSQAVELAEKCRLQFDLQKLQAKRD